MTTDELIRALRDRANLFGIMRDSSNRDLLNTAADRLEELEERIAIMAADMDNEWGKSYG